MKLQLSDEQAFHFLYIPKRIKEKKRIDLSQPYIKESILLEDLNTERLFNLHFFMKRGKTQIHLMDQKTKHTLIRINSKKGENERNLFDRDFHKNTDGTYVRGNRILLFSRKEFLNQKIKGGYLHYEAFPLPFKNIPNTEESAKLLHEFLSFTNVTNKGMITVIEQKGRE